METTKKIWTQADINSVIIERDWECEGALRVKNPVTLARYEEMEHHYYHAKRDDHGVFFAFSDEQFVDGLKHLIRTKAIEPIEDFSDLKKLGTIIKGKVFEWGLGCYGTREGVKAYLESADRNRGDVAGECNPQEVYCSEYNNFESMYNCDGDEEAINVIITHYGVDVARMIRRWSVYYSIDEIVKRMKKSA